MEHTVPADSPRDLTRPAVILGFCLIVAGAVMGLGFWLAFDRALGRFERSEEAHAASVRDAGREVGSPVARAVTAAGETIARPQIRVIDPLPIEQPVKIRGIQDDGTLPVEAKIAK